MSQFNFEQFFKQFGGAGGSNGSQQKSQSTQGLMDFFNSLGSPGEFDPADLGFPVNVGGGRFGTTAPGGFRFTRSEDSLRRQHERSGGGLLEQGTGLAFLDVFRQQEAADQQNRRVNEEIENFRGTLDEATGSLREQADIGQQRLEGAAGGLEELGENLLERFEAKTDEALGRLTDQIAKSEETFGAAITEFKSNQTQGLASSIASGVQQGMQSRITQINSRGDLTPQEKEGMIQQERSRAATQVQQAVAPVQERQGEFLGQMQANFSSLQQANAGLLAQTGVQFGAQRTAMLQQRAALGEASASLVRDGVNLRNAAELQATNFAIQGQLQIADLVRSNPRSIVSMFSAFSALLNLGSLPGIGQASALQLPSQLGSF